MLRTSLLFLIFATIMEVSGDAAIRIAIRESSDWHRWPLLFFGAVLLLGYGSLLNLAPLEFGQVAGLYIATLFIVWQTMNWFIFHKAPDLHTLIGGFLIVAGGLIVSLRSQA